MSNSKLLKYLERPMEFKSLVSKPVLISDSNGVYLKRHLDLLKKSRIFVQFEHQVLVSQISIRGIRKTCQI